MKLTLEQVAQSLNLPARTVERWIRQGRIPVQVERQGCTFRREVLEKWAAQHRLMFRPPQTEVPRTKCPPEGGLREALRRGGVHREIGGADTASVLSAMVSCVPGLTEARRGLLYERLLEREGLTSTGIGRGVAIPHPRSPVEGLGTEPMIVTGFPRRPVPFEAVDGRPVFVLFLLLSGSVGAHLQLLSRLAFCVRESAFHQFLQSRPPAAELLARVKTFENRCKSGSPPPGTP